MNDIPIRQQQTQRRPSRIVWVLMLFFGIIASLTAYVAFKMVRSAIASMVNGLNPPDIQEILTEPAQNLEQFMDVSKPLQDDGGPPAQSWDGRSPITILLLGVDSRSWETDYGPPLTDTIILATLNPEEQTAGMLSIPRDLWVNVPGMGYHKINQAYRIGEANRVPNGGAGSILATIEELFDIEVPYYAMIDFNTFTTLIDEIGGVKIDVPEVIQVDPLGDNNMKTIQPGEQTLPGDLALAYVRNRNTAGSDFDRIQRQQQVIVGIQKRLIRFELVPILLKKAPTLYDQISSGVTTNLTLQQAAQLAWLSAKIPTGNIRQSYIQPDHVTNALSYDGMSILQPIPEEILALRDRFFSNQTPDQSEIVMEMDLEERMLAEKAEITLRNGTYVAGLAAETGEYLISLDLQVLSISNAEKVYAQTTIIDYAGKPNTIAYLSDILNVPPGRIFQRFDPDSEADIMVILGEDWADHNTLP